MEMVFHLELCSGLYVVEGAVEEGPICLSKVELLGDRIYDSVLN